MDSGGVQGGVEPAPAAGARRPGLDRAALRMAAEDQAILAAQARSLDHAAIGQPHLGAGCEIQAGLDRALVAERDAEPGIGAEQASFADGDDLLAAAGERAHDRRSAADVRAVADHHPGADAALDHGSSERAGVEVAEALMHDRGALAEMRAEAHAVGVGDAHAARHDIVGHARELVDGVHQQRRAGRPVGQARRLEMLGVDRALAGPADIVEQPEDAIEAQAVRPDLAGGDKVQAQVDVMRIDRLVAEVADEGRDHGARARRSRAAGLGAQRGAQSADRLEVGVAPAVGEEGSEGHQQPFEALAIEQVAARTARMPDQVGEHRGRAGILRQVQGRIPGVEDARSLRDAAEGRDADREGGGTGVAAAALDRGDQLLEGVMAHGRIVRRWGKRQLPRSRPPGPAQLVT